MSINLYVCVHKLQIKVLELHASHYIALKLDKLSSIRSLIFNEVAYRLLYNLFCLHF